MQESLSEQEAEDFVDLLESIAEALDALEYRVARERAEELDDYAHCELCDRIASGVQAGVLYVTSLAPSGRARRAKHMAAELRHLVHGEDAAAEVTGEA